VGLPHSLLGLGSWEQEELGALLVVRRTPEQGELSAAESEWMEAFHPHVHDTLRRVRSNAAESVLRAGLAGCLEVLDLGVMFFDECARLHFHNEAAARLCIEWLHGPGAGARLDPVAAFAVPESLAAAVRRVALSTKTETVVEDLPKEMRATLQRIDLPTGNEVSSGVIVQLSRATTTDGASSTHRLQLLRLTPREREVAELAAQGFSNGEIASRLHKSERTVATQISSSLNKLGIPSRVHLARLFV
jgi:DNA-binding CsgD family transcriptional regulator